MSRNSIGANLIGSFMEIKGRQLRIIGTAV